MEELVTKYITLKPEIHQYPLKDDGIFPNNTALPLLHYKGILDLPGDEPAAVIERIFSSHGWENSWRNGVYEDHHYHSTAHEVLGIYSGHAEVQFGGPDGITLQLTKGDVIVIPAGVAHRNMGASNNFKCVGAYADGRDYDMNYGKEGERPGTDENIRKVPMPATDPVYGAEGSLISEFWK